MTRSAPITCKTLDLTLTFIETQNSYCMMWNRNNVLFKLMVFTRRSTMKNKEKCYVESKTHTERDKYIQYVFISCECNKKDIYGLLFYKKLEPNKLRFFCSFQPSNWSVIQAVEVSLKRDVSQLFLCKIEAKENTLVSLLTQYSFND